MSPVCVETQSLLITKPSGTLAWSSCPPCTISFIWCSRFSKHLHCCFWLLPAFHGGSLSSSQADKEAWTNTDPLVPHERPTASSERVGEGNSRDAHTSTCRFFSLCLFLCVVQHVNFHFFPLSYCLLFILIHAPRSPPLVRLSHPRIAGHSFYSVSVFCFIA